MQVYQLSRQNQYNEARASEVDTMGREKSFASGTRYQAGEQKKRDVKKFFGYGEFILVKSSRRCYGPEEIPTIESNLGGVGPPPTRGGREREILIIAYWKRLKNWIKTIWDDHSMKIVQG